MDFLIFIFLNLLGVISPGPDCAIVTRFGLAGLRRSALFATLGITCALLIHVGYCMSGALFLQNSPEIQKTVRFLGALYLGYLGCKMVFLRGGNQTQDQVSSRQAFLAGFITNLFNPKAIIFLMSLFTQFATSYTTLTMKLSFALSIPVLAALWFSSLSCCLTHPTFLPWLQAKQQLITVVMGAVLILLSASTIFTEIVVLLR